MAEQILLKREELYDMVWADPVTKVAARLGVSDVAVAKICRKMNVPRPPRGYWARAQYGYLTEKAGLPEPTADTLLEYWLNPPDGPRMNVKNVEPPVVEVREHLARPTKVVMAIRADLKDRRPDDFGRIGESDGPINVSRSAFSRACRILDALFRVLEGRGHSVEYRDGKVFLTVSDETMRIAIAEPARRIKLEPDKWGYRRWKYQPTGNLTLALSGRYTQGIRRQWSDGKVQQLEQLLGRLVVTIEQAPMLMKARREEEDRRAMRWRRKQLLLRRENDLIRLTQERAASVDKLVANRQLATRIREFVEAAANETNVSPSVLRLAKWARLYADHIDPFVDYYIEALVERPSGRLKRKAGTGREFLELL